MAIFRKSVNTILIGSVSLAVTVAIAGLVFYVSTSSHRMALQLEEQNLAQSADTLAKSIGQFLDDTASLAGTLADQAAVVAAFTESDPKRADERLKSYLESYKEPTGPCSPSTSRARSWPATTPTWKPWPAPTTRAATTSRP